MNSCSSTATYIIIFTLNQAPFQAILYNNIVTLFGRGYSTRLEDAWRRSDSDELQVQANPRLNDCGTVKNNHTLCLILVRQYRQGPVAEARRREYRATASILHSKNRLILHMVMANYRKVNQTCFTLGRVKYGSTTYSTKIIITIIEYERSEYEIELLGLQTLYG